MTTHPRKVTRGEFDVVCDAIWSEIEYQNNLPKRTPDEAKDVPAFATLGRRYLRLLEDHWADNPAEQAVEGWVVTSALNDLRKLAAVFVRAMAYCGVRKRVG